MSTDVISSDAVAALVGRLEAGATFDEVIRPVVAADHETVLRRAALPRTFDAELFNEVLAVPGGPDLEDLLAAERIEPVGGPGASFRVRRELLPDLAGGWWRDGKVPTRPTPPEHDLKVLLTELVAYHAKHRQPLDGLYHLVLLDQPRAVRRFEELYRRADRRFDLAACQDVISAVGMEARPTLIGAELRKRVQDRTRYLRVRGDHAADYYRTARFFAPPDFDEEVDAFLTGPSSRVVQVVAEGGMGKTMRMRWLIARKCIPERIPVARIDLDDVDPVVAGSDAWLVLLEMALQLHDQLPGSVFEGLAKDFGSYRPLLRRGFREGPAGTDLAAVRARAEVEVPSRVQSVLRETLRDRTIVLIIDTTEELVVPIQRDVPQLWEYLSTLLAERRGIRLIVAGRYDLVARLPSFKAAFRGVRTRRLRPFPKAQSAAYLRGRGVRDEGVVRAMVARSGGRPFKLALFGDIVQQEPGITAKDVRTYREPDLLFLVERVLDRIADPGLHWLLRYGVVPRRLTLDLARGPLAPLIKRGVAGDPVFDDTRLDPWPTARRDARPRFPILDHEPDVERLWQELRQYAADASWVSTEDPTTLRFQPEVVEPMRRILRGRDAWSLINEAAAAWFETRAASDPEHWGEWISEAAYHRFERDGQDALPWLQQRLDEARTRGHDDWIRRLAEEARRAGSPLEDETDAARSSAGIARGAGRGKPAPPSLVIAEFELAALAVRAANAREVAGDRPDWEHVRKLIDRVLELDEGRGIVPGVRLADLEGGIALGLGDTAGATEAIERGVKLGPDDEGQAALATLRVLVGADETSAEDPLGSAIEALSTLAARPDAWGVVATAIERLSRAELQRDRPLEAIRVRDLAVAVAPDAGKRTDSALAAADLCTVAGQPGLALDRLDAIAISESDRGQWLRREIARARAELAARRPLDAIRTSERVLGQLTTDVLSSVGAVDVRDIDAAAREVRGEALGVVMRFDEALNDLDQARATRSVGHDPEGAGRTLVLAVTVLLRGRGDLTQARQLLDGLQSSPPPAGGDAWTDGQLRRAEWYARTGNEKRAGEIVEETLDSLIAQGSGPARRVRAALGGLTLGDEGVRARSIGWLLAALREVGSSSVRTWLMGDLADAPVLDGDAVSDGAPELRRLATPADDALTPLDAALAELRAAELERATDEPAAAAARLRRVKPSLVERKMWQSLLDASATAARLHDPDLGLELLRAIGPADTVDRGTPLQRAAILAPIADALLDLDRAGEAMPLMDEALAAVAAEPRSGIAAHVRVVDGRLRARLGDRAGSAEAARIARETYVGLGDEVAASAVSVPLPALGQEGPDDILLLRIRTDAGAVVTDISWTPAGDQGTETRTKKPPAALARLGDPDAPPEKVYREAIDAVVDDWRAYGAMLGSLLPVEAVEHFTGISGALGPSPPPTRLALDVSHRLLQPVPWELATIHERGPIALEAGVSSFYRALPTGTAASDTIRFVQRTLTHVTGLPLSDDGIYGPRTRDALARFQLDAGLKDRGGGIDDATLAALRKRALDSEPRPPRVMLLRTSFAQQVASQTTGYDEAFGVDLHRLYDAAGFEVEVIESLDLALLASALGDPGNAIVHIAASTRVTSGGIVSLDVSDPGFRTRSEGPELIPSLLGRVLASRRGDHDPLVIVDVPRPSSPSEAARQLFLRNRFAADLFEQRVVSTVVATGLMGEATNDTHLAMLEALRNAGSVGDACSAARRARVPDAGDRRGFPDAAAATAIALFARTPDTGIATGRMGA